MICVKGGAYGRKTEGEKGFFNTGAYIPCGMAGEGDTGTVVYDLYETQGGDGIIMQEGKLRFAQLLASRVTGYPLEAIQKIKAKDSVALKSRVYRFFYLTA